MKNIEAVADKEQSEMLRVADKEASQTFIIKFRIWNSEDYYLDPGDVATMTGLGEDLEPHSDNTVYNVITGVVMKVIKKR